MQWVEADERRAYDGFVSASPFGHLLQSWRWGEFRAAWGWQPKRFLCRRDGRVVAAVQLLFRPTPLGTLAYVPRGPVCAPDDPAVPALLDQVARLAGRAFAVRFEPSWLDGTVSPGQWGLRASPDTQPRSTAYVDLRPSEAELLAGMHQKWRYNLGLAARRGVMVRRGGETDLPAFARMIQETARRDRFHARPAEYYAWAWRVFQPDSHLFVATREDRPLAACMTFYFADQAAYLYGASADDGRRDMPSYALQWEAIRHAKSAGLRRYDLWGIPDSVSRAVAAGAAPREVDAADEGLGGVWRFKRGLPIVVERTVGAWDLVLSGTRHGLFQALSSVRRRHR
jgi:lipid II:glycine glycyltransferase (peptidoglycan interpeptide bridge formation enzyme)